MAVAAVARAAPPQGSLRGRAHDDEVGAIALYDPAHGRHLRAHGAVARIAVIGIRPVTEDAIDRYRARRTFAHHRQRDGMLAAVSGS